MTATVDQIIIDRGRGPEIRGTRITVYDVMDYYKHGWKYDQIAGLFRLPPDWIQAAIQYIEDHREDVEREYRKILDRHRNYEYPPDVKEKLARSRERFEAFVAKVRSRPSEQPEIRNDDGGHERSWTARTS
ncbi:MAG: DUF433 domain-containing protein [Planctomycetes bacterium]|nr:DUF433 domain-containing protein [Planctomycetota bacterium]